MAVVAYLLLLAISLVSGAFSPGNQNGFSYKIRPNLSYQRTDEFRYPKIFTRQSFMNECLRQFPYDFLGCYQYSRRIRDDPEPKLAGSTLKTISGKLMPDKLKENNKQNDIPESYINSVLDEDKRDSSNFNATDNALNSTWIEIKDPRKSVITQSEIASAEEKDEFVSFKKKNVASGAEANSSLAEEKGIGTDGTATDSSNTDGETITDLQQQTTTITETDDIVTGGKRDEVTPVTGETSDVSVTNEVTKGKETANQDFINSTDIDEENKESTQTETTSVSSSENLERKVTADLHTDSTTVFKKETEKTIANATDLEVTTEKGSNVKSFSTEENLWTESRSTLTSVVPEDTTLATNFTTSTVFITTLPTDRTESELVSVSDADTSSSETESATSSSNVTLPSVSVTKSSGYSTASSDGDLTSTVITDSTSSNGDYVTKSIPIVPEHILNIRAIKTAKVVLCVLLLMAGLIAVVMLAIYFFRVRRGAVQYDQLTLLP